MNRPVNHLLNGQQVESISLSDRGLAYGDGLFETISVILREMPLWQYHIERLHAGCDELEIPWSHADSSKLRKECLEILDLNGYADGIIKVIVTRGEGGRGYSPLYSQSPSRIVSYFKHGGFPAANDRDGVAVKVCTTPLGHNPRLAGLKHLNRLEQVLATAEWQGSRDDERQDDEEIEEYQEGLMLDCSGDVIEGTKSNLFLVKEGHLITPSLTECGVKGVMRRYLLQQTKRLGIKNSEQRMSLDDLAHAEELFICNSVFGIWPVVKLAGAQPGHPMRWQKGRVTERLQQLIRSNLGLPLIDDHCDGRAEKGGESHQ